LAGALAVLTGLRHDAIDPTAEVFRRGHDPQRRDLADRYVEHQAAAAVGAAMLGVGNVGVRRSLPGAELRLIRHQLDGAAHGTGTVQGALGTAQHLDMIQVEQIRIDHGPAVQGDGGCRERRFVQIKTHRGRAAAAGRQAAHFVFGLSGTRGAHGDAGYFGGDILHRGDALRQQLIAADRGHADRGVLHRGVALLGGDDDLLEAAIVHRRGGRRMRRAHQHSFADKPRKQCAADSRCQGNGIERYSHGCFSLISDHSSAAGNASRSRHPARAFSQRRTDRYHRVY
jgi:hypothetical protein